MELAPTDLAYAAGVIDSDGYIGVHKSDYAMRVRGDAKQVIYAPRVAVKQVTPQAVDLLHDLFGGYRYNGKPTARRGRPLLVWNVHSAAAVRVCEALLPHLRIKREQAINAIEVGRLNASRERHRFVLPEVAPDEPMVTMAEAARRLGKDYGTVAQSVRLGNVPHIRSGPRKVLIPESYLPIWAERGRSAIRRPDITARLEAHHARAKELNRVGV
jgi:excisionase family DNA binding protein